MSNNIRILYTNRLELIATTLEHIMAELESPQCLASMLNVCVEDGWPPGEYDRNAQEFFRDRLMEGGKDVVGWYGWYAVRRGNKNEVPLIVGAGGYFGSPSDEGDVEIGFSVMPSCRGMGYATEIAGGLIRHAFTYDNIKRVIAHISPENISSRKVLEKCGFSYISRDEESGNDLFEILKNRS